MLFQSISGDPRLLGTYTPLIIHVLFRSVICPILSCTSYIQYVIGYMLRFCPSISKRCRIPWTDSTETSQTVFKFRRKTLKVKACTWQSEHFAMRSPFYFSFSSQKKDPLSFSLEIPPPPPPKKLLSNFCCACSFSTP